MSGGAAGSLAGAGSWIWKNRADIGKSLNGVYDWFKKNWPWKGKKRGILILGSGGAGKTTLAKLLAGKYDWLLENPGRYEESLAVEKYHARGGAPEVEVLVPPGQHHRRHATWNDLEADIAKGRFRGIVVLVAHGYDTLGQIAVEDHKLYAGDRQEFLRKYLDDRRKDELGILRQLAPHLHMCTKKTWLLTLVAKQDLWWDKNSDVERYYREGKYGTELKKILEKTDRARFRHELVLASLVISNFNTGRRDCLQNNIAGYDHQLQIESLRRVFQTIDALKNWEAAV